MAGSVTVAITEQTSYSNLDILTFTWTADASDGSVPATSSDGYYPNPDRRSRVGYIWKAVTDPGTTAPTDNYDITLVDDTTGADLMGGELANRDTANSEEAVPKIGNAYGGNLAGDSFTMNISNNAVNSATGVVYVYIAY